MPARHTPEETDWRAIATCTTCSPRPHPGRSSRSTARSRTDGRSVRTRASPGARPPPGRRAGRVAPAAQRARRPARAGGRHAECGRVVPRGGVADPNESEQSLLLRRADESGSGHGEDDRSRRAGLPPPDQTGAPRRRDRPRHSVSGAPDTTWPCTQTRSSRLSSPRRAVVRRLGGISHLPSRGSRSSKRPD